MRRFVSKTVLFVLPIILIGAGLELLLRGIPNVYSGKKDYLDAHSNEIEVLILGSSHSFAGINPAYFSAKCFNAAMSSQTLDLDLAIIKKYENRMEKLKTIILPISYFSLLRRLESKRDSVLIKNYILYFKVLKSHSPAHHSEILSYDLLTNINRVVSHYLKRETELFWTPLGWNTSYRSSNPENLERTGEIAAREHTENDYQSMLGMKDALESIIRICKKRDILVFMVTLPAFETYRKNLNRIQLELTIHTAIEIAGRYDNCLYMDLLEDSSYTADDFNNADHLNEKGAKKVSLMINRVLTDYTGKRRP